ncbi:PhzF family phenazine biosynthesis protein [Xenophilus arseniciresistens]|uniref:PhzF family phenazine biosynthesis protein n=1 Tax=Xenophilus arseniciresistens TaxID=1283306 RepID=A0AAE3T0K7_9BURK|nr:PhzF family phenazine biosynthesis protein [Xenophilus arseniciresistens]MDA7417036.1 PhzF family phenazine biosynthesis protein [Xenophilus arseniciresistens]
MTRPRPFCQVDVFTHSAGFGNPLAVVLDGEGLSDEAMQRFARWTNLSETTFVLPPTAAGAAQGADYRVRIFTPGGELPFAGHPTLGSAHAWLASGGKPRRAGLLLQECGVGLVTLRQIQQEDGALRLAFAAPALRRSAPSPMQLAKVAQALGLKAAQIEAAQLLDNGPMWLGLLLSDADTVLSVRPDHAALKALGVKVGLAGRPAQAPEPLLIARGNREARAFAQAQPKPAEAAAEAGVDLEVRAFATPIGVEEDPVTGSLNASLAQWLIADGHLPAQYVAGQGQCLGREGRVHIARDADGLVWVGGDVAPCITGSVLL